MKIEEDITWERAEQVLPGCSGEWDEIVLIGITGARGPTQKTEVTLELRWGGVDHANPILWVTENIPGEDKLHCQSWVRHSSGHWTSPLQMPKTLLLGL